MFGENLAILPTNFDLAAYRRDLATLDALRPRLARLSKLDWMHWLNHQRPLGPIGNIPPAEAEAACYRQQAMPPKAA